MPFLSQSQHQLSFLLQTGRSDGAVLHCFLLQTGRSDGAVLHCFFIQTGRSDGAVLHCFFIQTGRSDGAVLCHRYKTHIAILNHKHLQNH